MLALVPLTPPRSPPLRSPSHPCHHHPTHTQQAEAAAAQRRREEVASARVAALRSSDMSSYLALLQQTKNTRLQQVLAQTDACLAQIAHKLGQATQTLPAAKSGEGLRAWTAPLSIHNMASVGAQPHLVKHPRVEQPSIMGRHTGV